MNLLARQPIISNKRSALALHLLQFSGIMATTLSGQKMAELCHKAQVGEPLWIGVAGSSESSRNMREGKMSTERLITAAARRPFNSLVNKTEASKESAILFLEQEEKKRCNRISSTLINKGRQRLLGYCFSD
uniref:Uncharacterized protein n=1 Tax=Kalanchoe fedtschenkoi TaxID=63787 RepID=A0A7N0UGF3_KALFE